MERLLLLHLDVKASSAQVLLNGVPVAYVGEHGGRFCLPVHEYAQVGDNEVSVRVGPEQAPTPVVGTGESAVRVLLALCTQGQSPLDPNARILAKLEWVSTPRERHNWPHCFSQNVDLPVAFPRWRWLEAPVVPLTDAVRLQALVLMQQKALDLQVGAADSLVALCRLRTEELGVAYQREPQAIEQGFRLKIQQLFEQGRLKIQPATSSGLVLKPIANGRLVECLAGDGLPILRTIPDISSAQQQVFWPMRLGYVNGQFYGLR